MKKSELIKEINLISKHFDSKSYSIELNAIYKNKPKLSENALIITNISENYHLLIDCFNNYFKIYSVKSIDDIFTLSDELKYIPDFKKSLKIKNINNAVGKLYAEMEKKKIINLLKKIKDKYLNKIIDEKGLIELIIQEANENYGIQAYKEGKKFIFELSNSIMEIRSIKEKNRKIYKVYINNIFIFEFEKFLDAVESAWIEIIKNNIKKTSKRSSRSRALDLGLKPKLKNEIKKE